MGGGGECSRSGVFKEKKEIEDEEGRGGREEERRGEDKESKEIVEGEKYR